MNLTEQLYESEMQRGGHALRTGDLSEARRIFQDVIDQASRGTPAEPYEQLGIVLRLLADQSGDEATYQLADEAFSQATQRAKDDLRLAQVYRNWAMVALNQGDLVAARARLVQSCRRLRPTHALPLSWSWRLIHQILSPVSQMSRGRLATDADNKSHPDQIMHVEYFVTQGFIARLHSKEGGSSRKREARRVFRQADRGLRGHAPYELDNLIWRLKVEHPWWRPFKAPRLLILAVRSGNRSRQVQAVLLIISPSLAAYVERRHRERKMAERAT